MSSDSDDWVPSADDDDDAWAPPASTGRGGRGRGRGSRGGAAGTSAAGAGAGSARGGSAGGRRGRGRGRGRGRQIDRADSSEDEADEQDADAGAPSDSGYTTGGYTTGERVRCRYPAQRAWRTCPPRTTPILASTACKARENALLPRLRAMQQGRTRTTSSSPATCLTARSTRWRCCKTWRREARRGTCSPSRCCGGSGGRQRQQVRFLSLAPRRRPGTTPSCLPSIRG